MNTNHFSTFGAFPSFLLAFQKLLDTIRLDVPQIIDHTHSIFVPVAPVKSFKILAWKTCAFKTVLNLFSCQFVAMFLNKRT